MASRALAPVRRYDIPPYALSGRMWHYYPSPSELRSVGLENISYDVLTYNPDERTQKARELRRSLLDVFFRDMHKQDKATWESCAAVFQGRHGKRGDQEEYDEWIGEAIECVLREREMSNPVNGEPTHPDYATYQLVEHFIERLDGTVWLETATGDADCSQERIRVEQKYRMDLVNAVLDEINILQQMLFDSCRKAEDTVLEPLGEYEARVKLIEQCWKGAEEAYNVAWP